MRRSALAGHRDGDRRPFALEMTMNVYTHVSLDDRRLALDRLGDLFEEDAK